MTIRSESSLTMGTDLRHLYAISAGMVGTGANLLSGNERKTRKFRGSLVHLRLVVRTRGTQRGEICDSAASKNTWLMVGDARNRSRGREGSR